MFFKVLNKTLCLNPREKLAAWDLKDVQVTLESKEFKANLDHRALREPLEKL